MTKTRKFAVGVLGIWLVSTWFIAGCGGPGADGGSAGESSGVGGAATGGSNGATGGAPSSGGSVASGGSGGDSVPNIGDVDAKGWKLMWSDEFDGPGIDGSKWEYEVNCDGGGNNELQCYVADAKNSFITGGALHIVALRDHTSDGKEYSSARLRTRGKADFKYGRFEARFKTPFGMGLWPAFWMLPTNNVYGGWASSGEIDIFEAVDTSPSKPEIYGTLHYGGGWPNNVHSGTAYTPPVYIAENFLTYAVEWEEGEIRWFVDGQHYGTQDQWNSNGNAFPAPFDQSFHLLLNVAVGGDWPSDPDGSTSFPQKMVVEYVRVFQCSTDMETGIGCGSSDPTVQPL